MKNLFTFRQRPNESLTHRALNGGSTVVDTPIKGRAQVSAKCRLTVGRLSTLFLLLLLSFGFSSQAWGAEVEPTFPKNKYLFVNLSSTEHFREYDATPKFWVRFSDNTEREICPTKLNNDVWYITTPSDKSIKQVKIRRYNSDCSEYWNGETTPIDVSSRSENAVNEIKLTEKAWSFSISWGSRYFFIPKQTYVFFVKPAFAQWGANAYFRIGHGNWSSVTQMGHVGGTNLLYRAYIEHGWDGFRCWMFTNAQGSKSSEGGPIVSIYDVETSNCNDITHLTCYIGADVAGSFLFNPLSADGTYYSSASKGGKDGRNTYDEHGYSTLKYAITTDDINKTMTLKQQLSTNGGTSYTDYSEKKLASTLNFYSYKLESLDAKNATYNVGNITEGNASTTCLSALTASVKFRTSETATGYTFVGWFDSDGNLLSKSAIWENNDVNTLPINYGSATYLARFNANSYQVKFDGNGATSGSMNNEQYYYGVSQALTTNAFQKTNYNFVGWNTDKDAKTALYVDKESVSNLSATDGGVVTLYAIWALAKVDVTYGVYGSANGTIKLGSNTPITGNATQMVDGASTVVFTAAPSANYTVEGWYSNSSCTGDRLKDGDNTGEAQTYTIPNIAADETVYVKFRETTRTITVAKETGIASVSPSPTSAYVATPSEEITATLSPGYESVTWNLGGSGITPAAGYTTSNNPIKVNATADGTITATATEILHSVTMAASDNNKGTVAITSSNKTAGIATSITIQATPKVGYYFTGWTASDGSKVAFENSSLATTTAKVTADGITITANFAPIYVYLEGRARVKDAQGNETTINPGTSWNLTLKTIPFTFNSTDGVYYLNTYCTVLEQAAQVGDADNFIRMGVAQGDGDVTCYSAAYSSDYKFTSTNKSLGVNTTSDASFKFRDVEQDADEGFERRGPVMYKYDPTNNTFSYCAPKLTLSYDGAIATIATMANLPIEFTKASTVADGLDDATVVLYYSTNGANWTEWTDNITAEEGTYQLKAVASGNNEFGQPVTNVVSNIITVTVTTPVISAAITKINGAAGSVIRINDELTITPTLQNVPDGAHYTICYHYFTKPAGSAITTDVFTETGSGKDVNTFIDVEGDYTIKVTLNDKACDQDGFINLATYDLNFHVKGDEITVYTKLEKSVNWDGHYVYYYKGDDKGSGVWPGMSMTYIGKDSADYEWYKQIITNYKQYAGGYMVFSDGSSDYKLQQTVDVPMPEDDAFYYIKAAAQDGKRTTETLAQVDVTPRVILLTDTTALYQYITIDAQGKAVFFLGDDIKYEYSVTDPEGTAVPLNSKNEFSPLYAGNYTLTITAINRKNTSETVTNTFTLRVAENPLTLTPSPASGTIGSTVTLTLSSTQDLPSCDKTWTVIEPGSVDPVTFGTTTGSETSTTYTTLSSGTYTYQVILLDNNGKIIGKAQTAATVAAKDMYIKHPFVNKTTTIANDDWKWAQMTYEASDGTYIYYNNTNTKPSYYHKDKVANINSTGTDEGGKPEYTILNPDNVGDNTLAVFVYDLSANTVTVYSPVAQYRVKSETENGIFYSNAVSANNADLSFFATQDGKLSWQTRTASELAWTDMDGATITNTVNKDAVYTAKVAISDNQPNNTLSSMTEYSGDFTVYTSLTAADAGTGSPTAANGLMTQFTKASSADYYNYYWVRYCDQDKQSAATVGNDINHNLSVALPYYLLPAAANVRYGYDNTTNNFQRTFLAGSNTNGFIQIYGENLYTATDKTTAIDKANSKTLADGSDWIYTYSAAGDVTEEHSVTATLMTNYNSTQRWILAKSGLEADADAARTILNKDVATPDVYDLRILYDYKTNRLTAGWVPTDEPTFDKDVILIDQMIIRREGDGEASKVNIQNTGGIVVVDKMTTEFALNKADEWKKWIEIAGDAELRRYMFYWLSLPYKCKISEIYGLGVYGEKFEIQRYRGDLRALGQAGSNFGASAWRKLKNTATMEANRGYVIALKLKESDFKSAESKSYVRLFFPSTESVKLEHETQTVLPENEDNATSNLHWDWYIMGNPLLTSGIAANLVEPTTWDQELNYVYTWDYANGDRIYTPMSLDEVTLQATHSYMVQAKGTLNWAYPTTNSSAPTRKYEAAEFASGDGFGVQNIRLNLMENGNQVDKTYIMYRPNGTREYEIGRDLDKIINSGCSQMYSSMNEPLASICLNSEDEEMIPLTFVVTSKTAEYTVRLNRPMNNNLVPSIYDGQSGEYKNLSFGDVTLDLVKGTNAGRYFFVLKKNGVITNTDELNGNLYDQTQKVIMNDHLFIIHGGKLYDGVGASVK